MPRTGDVQAEPAKIAVNRAEVYMSALSVDERVLRSCIEGEKEEDWKAWLFFIYRVVVKGWASFDSSRTRRDGQSARHLR